MDKGAKLTYIDPRVTITATKANRYWMIRPGTDLALNYALIHTILKERLYDQVYVRRWVKGIEGVERPLWSPIPRSGLRQKRAFPPGRSSPWPGKRRRPNPRWSSITVTGAPTTPTKSISGVPSSS